MMRIFGVEVTARGDLLSELIRISDPDDERISAFKNIRERDLVGREGKFVAEGKVVLRALLASKQYKTESILLLENRVNGLRRELADVPPGTPVYVARKEVLDRIAGFAMHRGVLAIGIKLDVRGPGELLVKPDQSCLLVGCIGITNHDNVGSIFRNAAAFGADAVLLDQTCCDPLYRKALRVSVGAVLKVPFYRGGGADEMMALLSAQNIDTYAMSPSAKICLNNLTPSPRSAILLGSEGTGLPGNVLDQSVPVRIEMKSGFDSLNVAAASAITLHHFRIGADG